MKKPLRLSTAYATWVQGDDYWCIKDADENIVGKFPKTFSEKQMMQIIRLGRTFELEAFNIGINFGKKENKRAADTHVQTLMGRIASLEQMNILLSEKLEKFIIGESEEVV